MTSFHMSIQRVVFTSIEVQQQSCQIVWHVHDQKSKFTKIQTSIPYCLCISLIKFFSYAKRLGFSKFVKWSKTRWRIFMVVSSIFGTKIGGLWVGSNIMCFGCYFRSFKHCCWLVTLWHQHWSLMPTHPPTLPHLSEHLVKILAIKSISWIQCTNILTIGILTQYMWPLSTDLENWEDFGYMTR